VKEKGRLEVRLQQGVPNMADILLWPLATFLHAPDITGVKKDRHCTLQSRETQQLM